MSWVGGWVGGWVGRTYQTRHEGGKFIFGELFEELVAGVDEQKHAVGQCLDGVGGWVGGWAGRFGWVGKWVV